MKAANDITYYLNELQNSNDGDKFDERDAYLSLGALKSHGVTPAELSDLTKGMNARMNGKGASYLRYSILELKRKYK